MRGILVLLLSWSAPALAAAPKEKLKPLEFPAGKNNVQILSQRFEYALLDAEKLRIGDILIDSEKLRFNVDASKDGYRLQFTWPAALFTDGRLSILNNNGKAVWSEPFTQKSIKIQTDKSVDDEDIRSEIASYTSAPVDKAVVGELKFLPFLNFCISRETENTKIYLCSRDFYLHSDPNGHAEIRNRSASKKEAQFDINGKEMTSQGLIYLNDAKEDLNIHGQSESGASIEIITRKRDVQFFDVTLSNDDKNLVIRAKGAQPARKKGVRRIDDEEYEVTLPKGRPYYYILGEGGIPMRQEFFIRGAIPTEDMRPYLSPSSPERTYGSEIEILGVHPAKVKLKTTPKDLGELHELGKNRFSWVLFDLESGKRNQRSMTVQSDATSFIGSYEIYRGRANVLNLDVLDSTPNGILTGSLEYQRWMETFLGEFRSGLGFEYQTDLSKKDDVTESKVMTLAYRYRFTPGFILKDPSGGIGLLLSQFNLGGESSMGPAIELFDEWNPGWSMFPWWQTKFRYWAGSSGSDVMKLASAWRWTVEGLTNANSESTSTFRVLMGASQFSIADAVEQPKMQIEFGLGFGLNF